MAVKRVGELLFCALFALCLTACEAYMSLSFHIDNGNDVKVTLDVEDGSYLSEGQDEQSVFAVKRDGQELLRGRFIYFENYLDYVLSLEDLEVFEIEPEDGFPNFYFYTVYEESGEEYIFFDQVEDSDIGVILAAGGISVEEAEETFRQLHFEIIN